MIAAVRCLTLSRPAGLLNFREGPPLATLRGLPSRLSRECPLVGFDPRSTFDPVRTLTVLTADAPLGPDCHSPPRRARKPVSG